MKGIFSFLPSGHSVSSDEWEKEKEIIQRRFQQYGYSVRFVRLSELVSRRGARQFSVVQEKSDKPFGSHPSRPALREFVQKKPEHPPHPHFSSSLSATVIPVPKKSSLTSHPSQEIAEHARLREELRAQENHSDASTPFFTSVQALLGDEDIERQNMLMELKEVYGDER